MAVLVMLVLLFFSLSAHSEASYCVCNSGVSDSVLQKNIDYACGAGADCTAIQQNGACYNPNTVKDHCNYAVNSYYQRKGQAVGSCDFQSTAAVTANPPNVGSGCVFQSTPSPGGVNGPPTSPTIGGTPTSPTNGGTPTSPSVGGTPTTPNAGGTNTPNAGGTTTPTIGTVPGASTNSGFGLGPTSGGGFGTDNSGASMMLLSQSRAFMVLAISAGLLTCNFMCPRA